MLSADMLLTAAFAGVSTAQVHKPVTVVHEDGPISQGILSEGITYHNTAPGADGIFDGMSGQAVQSQPATTEKPVTQTENASGQSPATSADNEAGTTQNSSTAVQTTSTVETVTGSTASTESSAANSTISATSTSVSPNTMTQQLTTTLTAANGPPASTATSQVSSYQSVSSNTSSTSTSNGGGGTVVNSNASPNTPAGLFSTIEADIAAIESGNTYSTPPTTVTLGGVMTIEGLQLTFVTSGTTVTSVTISAASATLNLGGAVTSTITGLSGSYNPTAKEFSLTLGSGGAGSINIAFSSFVNITAASANLTYDAGSTTTVILSDTTTQPVSLLTVGMSDVTIVAGLNGSTGPGVELDSANLALALMSTSGGTTYYGVAASATALKGVGLPNDLQVGAGDLNIQINSTNDGSTNVVNFDASFPNPGGNGLAVPGSSFVLDYTQSLVQVSGTMNLTVGDYLQIGGGFSFTQVPGEVDVSVGTLANPLTFTVGPSSNPIFSASGSLSMTFTSTTFTINNAVLTINTSIQIASVLEVQGPSIGLSNLSIDLATGDLSGVVDASGVHHPVLTLAAVSATLFPGGSAITGSVSPTTPGDNGFQGTVDLQTGAFSITLEQFHLAVGSVFTADATGVLLTYDPNGSADQQLVQIGSGTLDFKFGSSDITGSLTDLTIYGNGFYFGSVTIAYAGSIGLGSILTVDSPSLTLTDFGVAYQNGTATVLAGSLTLAAGSATLNVGTAFSASATDLSITISLDPATLGQTTATASTVTMQISSILSIQATDITINSNPANGDPYLSVGSATVTLGLSSLTLSGTTSSFSIINANNTPELQPGPNFTVTLSATPGQLGLPSWLGFQIQKLEIQWQNNDFTDNPSQFRLILSASINSIQGLPGGVTVSGEITDAVIDTGKLENGQFPITSIGSVGGSVSGTLFGMEVNAGFVLGIVNFNPQNQIVNGDGTVVKLTHNPDGSVTETPVPGGNTTIADSVLYVGVAGGAEIPGVGGVQIYIGFSSLGPLTVYLSAEFPLILDPDTGLAIGGFSGGVIFDYTIPTPSQPMDLANLSLSPANITISQWQQQLRDQTVVQYTASGGGTNLTAAYTQPFVIEAGVTLYDAYAGPEAFTITGDIAIQIDPAQPNSTHIFVTGTATFGGGVNFNAFLYLGITVSGGTSSATVMFLVQEPAPPATVETFGGALTFGFTDASGNPITPTAPSSTTYSEWIALGTTYDSTGASSISDLPAGTYVWTPAANDTSLTVGGTTYLASDAVNGQVTFTTNATATATFAGTPNTAITGTLGSVLAQGASLPPGAQYTVTTFAQPAAVGGFYISLDGFASFSAFGALTATVTGSVTLTVTGSFAKIDLSGTLNVSDLGNLATASGELVVDYSNVASGGNLEIYGALKLQTGSGFAKLEGVGLYADGAATFVLNTTDSPQTVYLPDPTAPHDPTKATAFVINDFEAFEVTIAGTTTGTGTSTDYASLTYKIGGNTALTMQGYLDLRISVSNGLEIFADIHSLEVGPSATPFITFQGYGLFVINAQGFAAEMTLSLSSGTTASFGSGLTLDASFTLVMNTTSTDVTYTIPNTLPGLTVPDGSGGTTTIYSLTIPRGPPQGVQQPDGSFASIGATGPYIVITGSGTLGISVGSLSALSFQGFFRFELSASASGPVVSLYINMTGDVLSYTNIEVTGALQINTAGVVALLNMGVASGTTTDFGSGVIVSASFQLAINSTSSPVGSIGGVTLTDSSGNPISIDANTYELFGSGTLALGVGGTGFTITGSIFTSVSGTATTITVSGKLTATVAGTTFLTMQADGVLVADTGGANPGIAGALTLTLTNGSPLSGSGFDFNGTFDLRLNTTLVQQTVSVGGGTVTIAAGLNGSNNNPAPYVEVHAYGTLAFGTMTNGFLLDGDFYLAISTNGLAVSATATLSVEVGGVSLLSINTQAAMMINSSGLAATLTVSTHLTDGSYYYLGGTFQLMVNTTGTDVVIGGVTVPGAPFSGAAAGPYFELAITGAKLMLGTTNPSATTALYLDGDFRLTIGSTGLAITATATLNLEIAGTNFFSFTADGALLISQAGIAAQIDLTAGTNQPGDSNFSFNVTLSLEVNTTGSSVTSINSQNVNLPAQDAFGNSYYFDLAGRGSLTLAGIIKISGSFAFATGSNGVQMEVNGTVNILGVLFTINVDAGIYADGIEIYAVLGLSGGGSSASFLNGLITVKAQFVFEINTSSTQTHYGVPVNTAFALHIHNTSGSGNAQVYIFGFELTGQFDITIHNGGFQASGNLNFNFFGFGNVSIGFLFDSSGNYYFVGHLYVRLGSASFNIHGQLTVVFASTSEFGKTVNGVTISSNFELHVSGGATAFHINFASISADVKISGTSVDISVRVKVLFVHKTIHIHLGSLANVPTPPLPDLGYVSGGVLYLNITQSGEDYEITENGDGTITVYDPGISNQTVTYTASSIYIDLTHYNDSTVNITDNGANLPVTIISGGGTNSFFLGGGTSTVTGTTGNDTVVGGTGNVTFNAGSGTSVFIGGGTGSTHNVVNDPGNVTISESGYSSYSLVGTSAGSATLTYDGNTTALNGTSITVSLTGVASGTQAFAVTNYSGAVTLNANGNSAANVTTTITLDTGDLSLTGNTVTESNGTTGTITLENVDSSNASYAYGPLTLIGGSGANTFLVNGWTGGVLMLDGGENGDTYVINFQNTGSFTAYVNDSGVSGTDILNVNGSTSGDTINVSASAVALGSQTVNYSGIENLTVYTKVSGEIVNVTGTSAATTINTGSYADTINVGTHATSGNAGGTLNDITSTLTVIGSTSSDTLNLDDTGDAMTNAGNLSYNSGTNVSTLTGLFGTGGLLKYTNIKTVNLNLGSGTNRLTVQSSSTGTMNITGGGGNDTFNIQGMNGTMTVNTGAGINTVNLGSTAPLANGLLKNIKGALAINGGGTTTVNADDTGDTVAASGTLTGSTLNGLGMGVSGVTYSGLAALNISLGSGGNTFTISSTNPATVTTLNSGSGNDTINIQSTGGVTNVNTGSGTNTINVGSLAPVTGGLVNGIQGALTVVGSGSDTMNVDDTGDVTGQTGTLTATSLTGLGMGTSGITYSGLADLNISLGSGGNNFNIQSTGAVTNVNTGSGTNTINVGSLAPVTGGLVDGIQGALTVVGSGNDTMNVDDTGDATGQSGMLTATTLTGLGMGTSGITYSGLAALNISLGSGGNTFTITNTGASTVTTLNSGSGNDTINVQSTGAATNVNTGLGTNTINVGSLAPTTGGVVDGIQGALTIVGSGNDTLNVDDTGSVANKTGTLTATTLTGLGMGASGITYSGLAVLNISLGSGNDTFTVTGVTNSTVTTIDGGPGTNNAVLNFSGNFAAQDLTLLNFATATLYVGGDFSGLLNDPGAITTATIVGSLTATGVLNAGAIGVMTIGGDLAGLVNVTGLLDHLTVDGGTPGQIIAGDVHVITVLAGYGNKVLQVTEGGIEREILATPVNGGTMPGTVHFAFVYDSETDASPQLAIRITDTNPTPRSLNLALVVVNSSTATFNLSLVDSYLNRLTGVSNISLQGDLLTQLTAPELQLFTDLTASSRAGVVLPADSITGVEVSGQLTMGFIDVSGIEGLAFATLISNRNGHPNSPKDFNLIGSRPALWQVLGSRAAMNPATDAFVIPFNETNSVRLYAHDDTGQGMSFVMLLTDQLNDNAPITAYVQMDPALKKKLEPLVQSVDLVGNGGSIESRVSIANITSTGPLGDITVDAPVGTTVGGAAGLGNITAPSIFGSIQVTHGDIYGVIQTTSGDVGQVLVGTNGAIIGVTTIYCRGNLTGQIISRGNLISSVSIHGTFTGVIAAQGDIGAIQRDAHGNAVTVSTNHQGPGHVRGGGNSTEPTSILIRFGGIFIQGDDGGQIITLGNVFGDLRIDGVMTGRIAAQGQAVAGLAAGRFGMLGNVFIHSFAVGGAIVSDGLIGDAAGGTNVFIAENGHDGSGFLATGGAINLAGSTGRANKLPISDVVQNASGSNLMEIQAVFTNNSMPLLFDTGGSLDGLALIEMDLAHMQNTDGTLSGTIL